MIAISDPAIASIVAGVATVLAATIGFVGVVWQSRKTRIKNTEEHGFTAEKLDTIVSAIEETRSLLVHHIVNDHVHVVPVVVKEPVRAPE